MSTAYEIMTDKCVFCIKNIGIDLVKSLSACIVVSVACRTPKVTFTNICKLKSLYHLLLVVFLNIVNLRKLVLAKLHCLFGCFYNSFIYIKKTQIYHLSK